VSHPSPDQSDAAQMALARFLVVRACGYVEAVTEESVACYTESRSSPRVAQYARSWLGRGRNPSPGNMVDLVAKFDQDWAKELSKVFAENDNLLKRELSLMVDRRNKIAHGAGENITARKSLELAQYAASVADWFIVRFDPRT
jgi:hypothetical protein